MEIRLRPSQEQILAFTGGKMGIAAVPGSGKTFTLSLLAAEIIERDWLADDQEVLVVTLVNAAVDNFSARVAGFLKEKDLLPRLRYRVRTLHGLARDILQERPALAGVSDGFEIVDEHLAEALIEGSVTAWLHNHPETLLAYVDPALSDRQLDDARLKQFPKLANSLARGFIKTAKDLQLTPLQLRDRLAALEGQFPLLEMGLAIYTDYQRALAYQGALDFDDLIRLALLVIESDPDYLQRLRYRWPYILEDEAQDSSQTQERILRRLVEPRGGWVRVGDPNQSIYETFTTASPKYLRAFLTEPDVTSRSLANSGRSTDSIITLANHLVEWAARDFPLPEARAALAPPFIEPAPPGDPQPNPPDDPRGVTFMAQNESISPAEEIKRVVASLQRWLPNHPNETVAVLTARNERGAEVITALREKNLACLEILKSSQSTRQTAGILAAVLRALGDPDSAPRLAEAYAAVRAKTLAAAGGDEAATTALIARAADVLQKCKQVEDYLWPTPGRDWLDSLRLAEKDAAAASELNLLRDQMRRWQQAAPLPVGQLILTISRELFDNPADLALGYRLAGMLKQTADDQPALTLSDLANELSLIARNERKFLGFSEEDAGFEPDRHPGEVVVTTIHKAKGLEWDRVYVLSINNYDFPAGQAGDQYMPERYYLRGRLNLEAETLAQLEALAAGDLERLYLPEGEATRAARGEYVSERLRLLYVAITRARREVFLCWNDGRTHDMHPAAAMVELRTFWEQIHAAAR